jgi:hypothetical protein
MYAPGSRYARVPQAVFVDTDRRSRPYTLLRPFGPVAPTQQVHELGDGERLDLVAFRFFGDPEQFWRICDANATLRPDDLEVVGTRFIIPIVVR